MEEKNWIEAMIERQSIPETLREETTKEFCEKWGVKERTYYYHLAKPEIQKIILENSLNLAKKYTPDIMENLAVRAKSDNKASELFLEYVWRLSKQVDIKTDGKPLVNLSTEQMALLDKILYAQKGSDRQDDNRDSTGESVHSEQGV